MAIDPGFDVAALYNRAREMQAAEAARQQQLQADEQQRQTAALAAQRAEAERNRPRTWGEAAADTGLSAVQTVANVGAAGYGLANMGTLGTLDRATGFSDTFESLNQYLDSNKSAPLQARKEDLQTTFDEGNYLSAAGELLSSPQMLADYGVQSLGYLVPGMAAARFAGGVAAAGTAARGLSTAAQGVAAQQAATRAGLVAQGAMTAGYMNVDAVNAAREAGRSEEEQQLYGLGAGAVGAVLGPAISRVTGAAGMEARAAQAFTGTALPSATGNLAGRVAAGVGVQAVEEGAQESYEQVLRNVAAGDPLGEGVGQSATMGAVLGGIFGGALGASSGRQATREEAASIQRDVERELVRAGMAERGVMAPSALSDWEGPAGMGRNAAVEQFDAAGQPVDPTAQPEIPPVVDTAPAQAVAEPTGLNAVLAQYADQRAAARQAAEETQDAPAPVVEPEPTPYAPRSVEEIFTQTATLDTLRRRFGEDTAQAEAQRRGPESLELDDVLTYHGQDAYTRETFRRQNVGRPAADVVADPEATAPIDLTQKRVKRDYLRGMKDAVSQATGRTPQQVSGPIWNKLINEAAEAGITPQDPRFPTFMAVKADTALQVANLEGREESALMAAITNAYPVELIPADVRQDAELEWGQMDLSEDAQLRLMGVQKEQLEQNTPYPIPRGLEAVDPEGHGRWQDETYRANAEGMLRDLTEGGDVAYVRDANEQIVGRTPSTNPQWWQNLDADSHPGSVRKAREAVRKALAGEPLGTRQARFVSALMNLTDPMVESNNAYRAEQEVAQQQAEAVQRELIAETQAAEVAAIAQETPLADAPGASQAAQAQTLEGAIARAYTDAVAAIESATDVDTLNQAVSTIRQGAMYQEFSYDQQVVLESRVAEQWSVVADMGFRLGDKVSPTTTGVVAQQRFQTLIDATPARLGVQVQGFDTVADLSAHLGREMPANMKGVKTADNQIFIVRENHTDIKDVAFTIAHEQGHVGLEALLGNHLRAATNRMWANGAMRKRIKTKMAELNLQTDTTAETNASRALAAEEVLVDMLAAGERLNKDVWAKLRAGVKDFFARMFGVRDYLVTSAEVDTLLDNVAKTLRGDADAKSSASDPDMALWFTNTAAAAAVDDKFSKVNADFLETLEAAQNETDNRKLPPLADFAKSASEAAKVNATKALSWVKNDSFRDVLRKNFMHLNQMVSFYDKLFGGRIGALADLKTAAESTFNKMNAKKVDWKYNGQDLGTTSVNDFAREWSGFGRKQPAKHKALNTLMSQATFYKVFPDRPWADQTEINYEAAGYTQEARQQAHERAQRLWNAIGTDGQRIYKTTQAIYADRWHTRYNTLLKELDRIGKVNRVDNPEGAAIVDAKISKYKEDIRLALGKLNDGPYSPLQRNGKYTVVVTDADTGQVTHFSAYDTKEASQATAASLREQYSAEVSGGNFNVIQSTRDQFESRLGGTSVGQLEAQRRRILEDVESMLPTDMDADARLQVAGTVSNALTETYLAGLPDGAFMKHARTRKNVEGYDLDAFRAFADYMLRSARDIAGIEYDGQIANALGEIETFTRDVTMGKMRPDGTEGVYEGDTSTLRDVTTAVKRQHAASLDVDRAPVVKNAIQGGYLWLLTSPSQLFLNASQTHLVAFPRLAAKYGGGTARRNIHKAMGEFFKSKGSLLGEQSTLRRGDSRDSLVLDALQQIYDDGPLDLTQAHQVSEYAGGRDAALSPYMSRVVELASVFMHRSEVFNREVTATAAIRLEMEKRGGNIPAKGSEAYNQMVQEMTKTGIRAIDDTHFNYAQSNKPSIMQTNVGSLVFQFQQYRFHMLALLAKDIRDARLGKAMLDPVRKAMGQDVPMLNPMDAAEAREARAALSWLLGVHLAFTGAAGTVLAPFVFAILDAFKDEDDLTDSRTDFINTFGKYAAHGVLAGVIDTTRVSTATLIPYFGEKGYEPVTGEASGKFEYHVLNNLGPWLGLAGDALDGTAALLNGDMYKASQGLLPKPLRDAIKAPMEATQGVKDSRGVVYHEPSVLSSFTQFLGVRSAERRDITDQRSAVYKANKLARDSKDRYLNRLALAQAEGDVATIQDTQQRIQQWNARYPDLAIKQQDIRQAIRGRLRTQQVASETGISSSRMPSESINAILGR